MKKITKIVIFFTDWISSRLLDNPTIFNYVRFILAGRQKRMKEFIKKYLDQYECGTVADICSGTGDFAELISEDARYVGFDLNEDFIDFAKNRYINDKNKKFVKVNVLASKIIQKSKFDAVMLISALHHFSDNDLKILLPLVEKMTKKVVIIADIIPDPPHLIQKFFARIDRGKFVRTGQNKTKILNKYFKIIKTLPIPTRSAVQLGIVCESRNIRNYNPNVKSKNK
jgi:ubiquinone/menaquinone biosynthesis C-methylase UbiE